MKVFVTIIRLLVGFLFIFSGLIKSNDPTGFSYKLDEYFTVFADDLSPTPDSLNVQLKSLDDDISIMVAIPSEVNELFLNTKTSAWAEVEIDEETTIYVSSGTLSFGGQMIKEVEMNASDSGEIAYGATLTIAKDGKTLISHKVNFIALDQHESSINLDVSSYQESPGWYVGFLQGLREYALILAVIICVIEIVLGIALIIGFSKNLTLSLYFIMLLFFAFLTWYSAEFNKVTDCGCFGDAIKLTPWQSFNKDLILLIATSILFIGRKHIKPWFSLPFAVRTLTVVTLLSTGFSLYCWHYLPVKNFLKFKEGTDIKKEMQVPEGGRESDHIIREYVYDNNGTEVIVVWDSEDNSFTPNIDGSWTFVEAREDKILEHRTEPNIHDFKIMDETLSSDYTEDFFNDGRWKLMIVMNDLSKTDLSSIEELKTIMSSWQNEENKIYILTASDAEEVQNFRHENQIDIPFYYGDKTNLKSIIRSNPGLLLIDSSTVVDTWPSTRLPKAEKLIDSTK